MKKSPGISYIAPQNLREPKATPASKTLNFFMKIYLVSLLGALGGGTTETLHNSFWLQNDNLNNLSLQRTT